MKCLYSFHVWSSFLTIDYFKGKCKDSDNGKTDELGEDCKSFMYHNTPENCGNYDDDDFTANSMCCACIGNYSYDKLLYPMVFDSKYHLHFN